MPAPKKKQSNRAYKYARRSSPGQNELSEVGQFYDMDKHLANNDLVDAGEYEDVGSGLSTDERPGFLQMVADALNPANDIGHVVFPDLSRYTRSKKDPYFYLDLFDDAGITVHTVTDGIRSEENELMWDIRFSLNHEQSRKISFLTLRGQRDAIAAGFACSSKIPYGYKRGWVKEEKGQLHPIYVPHEVHAEHVQMMYEMRDKGRRTGEICERLMMLEIKSPTGLSRWPKGTIVKILKNRANIGDLEYFKTSRSKFPRNRKLHGPMVFVGAHEPLVDEALFNRVQQSIADSTRPPKDPDHDPVTEAGHDPDHDPVTEGGLASPRSLVSPNPLSELVKCAHCSTGSSDPPPNMIIKNGRDGKELTCSAKKNTGVSYCQSKDVPLEPFLNIIASALLERVLTRDFLKGQIQYINENSSQLVAEERERQAAVKKRITEINREAGNLKENIKTYELSHPIATGNLMDDLEKLGKEKKGLESRCSALDDDVAETMTFATEPEAIIEAAMDLRTYLEADDTATARKFLRGFIKRVDVAHGTATIHCGLPLPNTQETESGYSTTVSLDDGEFLLEHGSPLRTGQHHSHFEQGLRRMGRTAGRQRDRLGGAGPPAAPQPRTEHPRRKLPAQGETPGGAIPVATPHQRSVGGGRRQLRALTKSLSKYQVVQF